MGKFLTTVLLAHLIMWHCFLGTRPNYRATSTWKLPIHKTKQKAGGSCNRNANDIPMWPPVPYSYTHVAPRPPSVDAHQVQAMMAFINVMSMSIVASNDYNNYWHRGCRIIKSALQYILNYVNTILCRIVFDL